MKSLLNTFKNDIEGQRIWCGPTVLASILDKPISECNRIIEDIHKSKNYSPPNEGGVPSGTIIEACAWFGIALIKIDYNGPLIKLRPYCLSIVGEGAGHYVVTHIGRLIDTYNKTPTLIRKTRFKTERVREAWKITPRA